MIGAVIGDIVGSRFEWDNHRSKDFELFTDECSFTDDSVMSLAVCDAIMQSSSDRGNLGEQAVRSMQKIGRPYPHCGYGGSFRRWMYSDDPQPYNSYGNGAAMRVSGCGYAGNSIDEVKRLSRAVTEVTHNHPEGIKGAEAVAVAVLLARTGRSMDEIRDHIEKNYYTLDFTLDDIRETYKFNSSCQGTVPQAFEAFFESTDFEDAVRNAISIGGDSDTLAAITGSIAEAYYGVPSEIREKAAAFLDKRLLKVLTEFEKKYPPKRTNADLDAYDIKEADTLVNWKKMFFRLKKGNMDKLTERYGDDIVFVETFDMYTITKEHLDEELPKNAISAYSFRIGCYDVVITERLFKDDNIFDRIPADSEAVKEMRENKKVPGGSRLIRDIYARRSGTDEYLLICSATETRTVAENVSFIGAVKANSSMPDANADLMVLRSYYTVRCCYDYLYVLKPCGEIRSYRSRSSTGDEKTKWQLEKTSADETSAAKSAAEKYRKAEKNNDFGEMTDYELRVYVPDVYQKSIYPGDKCHINFGLLKANGIKFLSFDIDDTIIGLEQRHTVPPKTIDLFEELKKDFKVILFSNGSRERVERVAEVLGIEYIARAGKPNIEAFREMQERFGVEKSEMAHIGNNLIDDIRGGNMFGITTCLVRRKGRLTNIPSTLGFTGGKYLRKILKERDIWYKHHRYDENDQYYQLGNKPIYYYHRPFIHK